MDINVTAKDLIVIRTYYSHIQVKEVDTYICVRLTSLFDNKENNVLDYNYMSHVMYFVRTNSYKCFTCRLYLSVRAGETQ